MSGYNRLNIRRTFNAIRREALADKRKKDWVPVDNGDPIYPGLYYTKVSGEINSLGVSEYFINKKGDGFWLGMIKPTHYAKIKDYVYIG